ncbi:MAG TPA: PTS sugar transporter subunit IIA [Gemmatimonadales bacterium]|nr:PTS sugar transporter subunit IIA [Gemmatimonadales bacterium]
MAGSNAAGLTCLAMRLRDFLGPSSISLDLGAGSKDAVIDELVGLLKLDERTAPQLSRLLKRREVLGSTGFGRGIAIPHCRAIGVADLRIAFGLHRAGLDYEAVDGKPVHVFFLIVAPPNEVSNQYLPVLGRVAQFVQNSDVPDRLLALGSPAELFELFDHKGV